MDYVITFETKDGYHIETFLKYFECFALVEDYAHAKIGQTARNGSIIGKVRIAGEDEEPITTIE